MNSIDPLIPLDHARRGQDGGGDLRRRALGFAAGFLVIAAGIGVLLWWRYDRFWPAICLWASGPILVALAVLKPELVLALRAAWLTAAGYFGKFNTFVILTLLYFLAVVPIGLTARLFRRDRLGLRRRRDAHSYWRARDAERDPSRFERPY